MMVTTGRLHIRQNWGAAAAAAGFLFDLLKESVLQAMGKDGIQSALNMFLSKNWIHMFLLLLRKKTASNMFSVYQENIAVKALL